MNLKNKQQINGNVLLINPAYVHLDNAIIEQPETAVFPFGLLYVGHLIEARGACVTYLDNQRTNITKIIKDYDYCGINVIGSQNIFTANRTYQELIKLGFPPDRILLGGQGIEGLSETEFNRVFPNALQFKTQDLAISGYWSVNISSQLDKFSDEDLEAYLKNELVIPFTQGCKHRCSFCSAANARKEQWYDASSNLETYFKKAREFEIYELTGYATALNFFQMAEKPETKKKK